MPFQPIESDNINVPDALILNQNVIPAGVNDEGIPDNTNTKSNVNSNFPHGSAGKIGKTTFPTGMGKCEKNIEDSSYAIECSTRIREAFFPGDPYTYRINFRLTFTNFFPDSQNIWSICAYQVAANVTCPEFNLEDYLCLRKKHLFYDLITNTLLRNHPKNSIITIINFPVQPFEWRYIAKDFPSKASLTDANFKTKVHDAFSRYVKNHTALIKNTSTAISKFYENLDAQIERIIDFAQPLHSALKLTKHFGVYEKSHTADILDYLFGDSYQLYNGEEVKIENSRLLIPNWWVKTNESFPRVKKYIGYGMRLGILKFDVNPYPWAIFRINTINNTIASVISDNVAFGRKEQDVGIIKEEMYIAASHNKKITFKKLSERYNMENVDSEKYDILVSLALGELESKALNEETTSS